MIAVVFCLVGVIFKRRRIPAKGAYRMFKTPNRRKGFALIKILAVVGVLAVLSCVAIPCLTGTLKEKKFTQCNDHARTVFMAAQERLTELRRTGKLDLLTAQAEAEGLPALNAPGGCYVTSQESQDSYALILPADSVDPAIREEQVIIEYDPQAGIIYSVFYHEGNDGALAELYADPGRNWSDEAARKALLVGYCSVLDLDPADAQALNISRTVSRLSFTDGTAAVVTVEIPMAQGTESLGQAQFIRGLEVRFQLTGQRGGSFAISRSGAEDPQAFRWDEENHCVLATLSLDSLTPGSTDAPYGFGDISAAADAPIRPGDNLSVTAEVTYHPAADDPLVVIEGSAIRSINPMFHALTETAEASGDPTASCTLEISNARHLQNLNKLDPGLAQSIDAIVFVDGSGTGEIVIDWTAEAGAVSFTPIDLSPLGHMPDILGNGVQIRNLVLSGNDASIGLFPTLKDSRIEGIHLIDPVIETTAPVPGGTGTAGPLIGTAEGVTVTDCSVLSSGSTFRAPGRASVGGLVGCAVNSTFTDCSVEAAVSGSDTAPVDDLGGFVGTSINCAYTGIRVTWTDRPEYAENAGGFAGIMTGDRADITITDLEVTFHIPDRNGSDADTLANFGGVACQYTAAAAISDVSVTLNGNFNHVEKIAAGAFAAMENASASGFAVDLRNGAIEAESAAGFAACIGSGTAVRDSYVLGTVKGSNPAGFALRNSGTIQRCMANTTLSCGHAFVQTNSGRAEDCYAWTSGDASLLSDPANYASCYFGSKDGSLVLCQADGSISADIADTEALTDRLALEQLNGSGSPAVWQNASGGYPYPELTSFAHTGDDNHAPPATHRYPYALSYQDAEMSVLMTFAADGTISAVTTGQGDPSLTEPVYYLCHRTTDSLEDFVYLDRTDPEALNSAFDAFGIPSANILYTIYKLESGKAYPVRQGLDVQTYYPLYDLDGAYRIRSAEQFANIAQIPNGTFYIDSDVTVSTTLASFGGTLYDTGSITITATDSLVTDLTGTISGLTVTGLTAPMVGTIDGGTVTRCEVSGKIETGENVGIIAGTMPSGAITDCVVSGSVSGSGCVGGVVGRSAGTLENIRATLTAVTASGENPQTGALVGYATAGSIRSCTLTAPDGVAFANFPEKESLHKNAQYISRYDHGAENDINIVSGQALNMVSVEGRTDTLITSDVTVEKCTLNRSAVPIARVYYYHRSDLKCTSPANSFDFIEMKSVTADYEDIAEEWEDTTYYVQVTENVYEEITDVSLEENDDDDGETAIFTYKTASLGKKKLKGIDPESRIDANKLKLYTKAVHSPSKGSYMIFNQAANEILIYNENGFDWVEYDTTYYSHMIWVYRDGLWTNAYLSDGRVTLGETVGFTTVKLTYGTNTAIGQLYPVTAYRTITQVDSANILNGNDLT